jgi:hypothetical protein
MRGFTLNLVVTATMSWPILAQAIDIEVPPVGLRDVPIEIHVTGVSAPIRSG